MKLQLGTSEMGHSGSSGTSGPNAEAKGQSQAGHNIAWWSASNNCSWYSVGCTCSVPLPSHLSQHCVVSDIDMFFTLYDSPLFLSEKRIPGMHPIELYHIPLPATELPTLIEAFLKSVSFEPKPPYYRSIKRAATFYHPVLDWYERSNYGQLHIVAMRESLPSKMRFSAPILALAIATCASGHSYRDIFALALSDNEEAEREWAFITAIALHRILVKMNIEEDESKLEFEYVKPTCVAFGPLSDGFHLITPTAGAASSFAVPVKLFAQATLALLPANPPPPALSYFRMLEGIVLDREPAAMERWTEATREALHCLQVRKHQPHVGAMFTPPYTFKNSIVFAAPLDVSGFICYRNLSFDLLCTRGHLGDLAARVEVRRRLGQTTNFEEWLDEIEMESKRSYEAAIAFEKSQPTMAGRWMAANWDSINLSTIDADFEAAMTMVCSMKKVRAETDEGDDSDAETASSDDHASLGGANAALDGESSDS